MADRKTFDDCPVCGGSVYATAKQYGETLKQFNEDNPDIPAGTEHGVDLPPDPEGDVGICGTCGVAVAARGSAGAAPDERVAESQIPAESPEHSDDASGTSETTVHAVDPDAVPAT